MDHLFLIELTTILFGALLGGVIAFRIRQPVVLGYIFAGLFLGTLFPNFLNGPSKGSAITTLAEIGVALLLFTLGLEFSLSRLKKVGKPAILGASLQIILVLLSFSLILPVLLGINFKQALFLGGIASLSSTAVVAKLLNDSASIDSLQGDLMMAWLIVQDLAVVPLILILPVVTSYQSFDFLDLFLGILKSAIALYLIFLFGKKTVPYIFRKLALFNSRELLLVSAFVFCILLATLAEFLGLSFAIGAFIGGILISTSAVNHEVFTEIRPLRDLFSSMFFVSLGFLISIPTFIASLWPAILITFLVLTFKLLIILGLTLFFKYHSKIAFVTSFGLFQIGEFGFILAKIGLDSGSITLPLYQAIVSSSIITLVLTPFLFKSSPKIYKYFRNFVRNKYPPLYRFIFKVLDSDSKMPKPRKYVANNHIILIGYGRVGRYLAKLLSLAGIEYVVIDLHYKAVNNLRKKGIHSVYGDAVNPDVLLLAGIKTAKGVIIATPDVITNELIINTIRRINPSTRIIGRAHKEEDIARLYIRGVKEVIEPEFEASLQIGKRILEYFGKNPKEVYKYIQKTREEKKY